MLQWELSGEDQVGLLVGRLLVSLNLSAGTADTARPWSKTLNSPLLKGIKKCATCKSLWIRASAVNELSLLNKHH